VGFDEASQIPPAQRRTVLSGRLQRESPTWAGTSLGRGLMDAVEMVNNVSEATQQDDRIGRCIVLVSDMQQGSRLAALSDYPWPEDVELDLRPVKVAQTTNAGLHRLADREPAESQLTVGELRVRVSNDAESAADQFRLEWLDGEGVSIGDAAATYVPAGESRVVRVHRPKNAAASRLRLSGDGCDFDNTLHFTTRAEAELKVVYLGTDETDDPQGLRYYLQRALTDGLSQPVEFIAAEIDQPLPLNSPTGTPLVVITTNCSNEQRQQLREYAESGGTLLFVLTGDKPTAAAWAPVVNLPPPSIREAVVDNYTMLRQIAFDDPLFAAMSGAHFNDFTQIRFWKHRRLAAEQLTDANILARFENGDPALAEWQIGEGRVYVLTSGWHPADSQLARSWKFVLLVSALVEGNRAGRSDRVYFVVNDPVPLREREEEQNDLAITKPDGTRMMLPAAARSFDATNIPGVYSMTTADGVQNFAVNLDPMESRTATVGAETLEQLGCRLAGPTGVAQNQIERQQLQDAQLESRQKIWQWLIMAALGLVVTETWLAGRATKPSPAEGVPA
jgi:hypothetical protein